MILHFRGMQYDDVEYVHRIETNAHLTPWAEQVIHDCITVGYDCRVLELIKGHKESIVGYVICRYTLDTCHILNLCISKEMQNKGLGKILLNNLLETLTKPGISNVILEVRPSNKVALKLYTDNGFQQCDVKREYYSDQHGKEDAILLRRKLSI